LRGFVFQRHPPASESPAPQAVHLPTSAKSDALAPLMLSFARIDTINAVSRWN
jgi:hypothetical protein